MHDAHRRRVTNGRGVERGVGGGAARVRLFYRSHRRCFPPKALLVLEKISDFGTIAFLFLFDKYYLIMD